MLWVQTEEWKEFTGDEPLILFTGSVLYNAANEHTLIIKSSLVKQAGENNVSSLSAGFMCCLVHAGTKDTTTPLATPTPQEMV